MYAAALLGLRLKEALRAAMSSLSPFFMSNEGNSAIAAFTNSDSCSNSSANPIWRAILL